MFKPADLTIGVRLGSAPVWHRRATDALQNYEKRTFAPPHDSSERMNIKAGSWRGPPSPFGWPVDDRSVRARSW